MQCEARLLVLVVRSDLVISDWDIQMEEQHWDLSPVSVMVGAMMTVELGP